MIRFSLACDQGHAFESWFPSGASFDAQCKRGLVSCPICGSTGVGKGLMAPAIGTPAGRRERPVDASDSPAAPAQPVAILSEREQALRAMMRAVREHVTKTADYVGPGFAAEARRMHFGEVPHRSIYGEADPGEAKALVEEGIEVHPLPRMPEDRN